MTLNTLDVFDVANGNATVTIAESAMMRVHMARDVVDRIVDGTETVYGINTGFASSIPRSVKMMLNFLQLNLIRSHATGLGPTLSKEIVRSMMCVRLNSLAKGHSGCHPDVIHQLVDFINHSITPVVPRIGSLGASGDFGATLTSCMCFSWGRESRIQWRCYRCNGCDTAM